jgi:hypothetical protein
MTQLFSRELLAVALVTILINTSTVARLVTSWPYDELFTKADLVAVVEVLYSERTSDVFVGDTYGRAQTEFEAFNTRFNVLSSLKTTADAPGQLTVLHFTYSRHAKLITNGASFIRFPIGVVGYEKRELRDGTPTGRVEQVFQHRPKWLAFLKRRADGRFEPLTGQYDASQSFKELYDVWRTFE